MKTIGFFILLFGGISTAWTLLWYVLNESSKLGANMSKKLGTDNENTDQYIEQGKSFSKDLLQKIAWRAGITIIGLLLYLLGK